MSNDNETANEATEDPEAIAEAKRILGNQQWPMTVELHVPVEFGKETIATLTFRKGNAGDLKDLAVDRTPTANELMLIASRLSGRSLKVIQLLDPEDVGEVIAIALGFFSRCLPGGKRRSR